MPTIKFFFLLSYSSYIVIWQTFFYFSFFEGEHTVRFVPKEEGVHYLHARLNGIHIPGSPFKLEVQGNNNNNLSDDPSSVAVRGLGIDRGTTGKASKVRFFARLQGNIYSTISSNFCPFFTDIDICLVYVW